MAIHQNCHLIAVTGGKGGVGKSVLAANLSIALLKELRVRVLLIDLDQKSCGDQNIITGLRPKKNVSEFLNYTGAISPQSLEMVVTSHPSGLHYIGAVNGPDQSLNGSGPLLKKQLSQVSQFYNFIICDIGTDFGELQIPAIEEASAILTVTTPEILAVNQTKKMINELNAQMVPQEYFQVVINGVSRASLDPKLIAQSLGRPPIGLIPQDDLTVYSSVQRSTPFVLSQPTAPITQAYYDLVRKLSGGILQKLKGLQKKVAVKQKSESTQVLSGATQKIAPTKAKGDKNLTPEIMLKMQIHAALIKEMDLKKDFANIQGDPAKEQELKSKTQKVISMLTDRFSPGLPRDERSSIIKQVLDEALALGPLEDMLADPTVTEIMVNGPQQIYLEKSGRIQLSPIVFTSEQQLRNVIERIVTPLGRIVNETTPYVDARLKDGSRVNAVIPPVAIDGSSLTIRKFPTERISIDDYTQRFNSLTREMAEFLKICVEQGLNVIISGGTGSGKTTLLNVMSGFIPSDERIVTVEDAAELQMKQEHVVRLETKPKNVEGKGEITIRDLVRNALRMRPDRIVVGECRDGAALDMLSAMNTGHDGSMTTVHANNPRECISRLETLCLMAGMDLPARAIREQIASAVNLIVQISRFSDGSRKVSNITEVVGMQGEVVTLQEIFKFKESGYDKNRKVIGQFQSTGSIPTFIEKFEQRGVSIPRNLFTTNYKTETPTAKPKTAPGVSAVTGSNQPPKAAPKPGSSTGVTKTPLKKVSGGNR